MHNILQNYQTIPPTYRNLVGNFMWLCSIKIKTSQTKGLFVGSCSHYKTFQPSPSPLIDRNLIANLYILEDFSLYKHFHLATLYILSFYLVNKGTCFPDTTSLQPDKAKWLDRCMNQIMFYFNPGWQIPWQDNIGHPYNCFSVMEDTPPRREVRLMVKIVEKFTKMQRFISSIFYFTLCRFDFLHVGDERTIIASWMDPVNLNQLRFKEFFVLYRLDSI